MIFCTLYNPVMNIIYRLDELQTGNTFSDVNYEFNPAGKGITIAKVVRALGEEVCVIGIMPENDTMRFSRYLEERGITSFFFPVEGSVRVNTTLSESETGNVTTINSSDYLWSIRIQDEFQEFLEKHMNNGDIWALSGNLPKGFDSDTYMKVIRVLKEKGVIIMLDSQGLAFNMGVRAKPDMVKPNSAELEAFFGEEVEGVHHIALKGKRLLDMGIEYVFVSLGSDGMIAVHENDCLLCSAPDVEAIDTAGSGDALIAGVIVAKSRNFSFVEACRMGVACGTSNALHHGQGIVDNDEIWRLMEDVRIEAV